MVLSKELDVKNVDSRYPCKLCPKTYLHKDGLTRHIKFVHPYAVNHSTECELCGKDFSTYPSLVNHKRKCEKVTNGSEQRIECTKCSAKFSRNRELNRHKKSCWVFRCKKKACKN